MCDTEQTRVAVFDIDEFARLLRLLSYEDDIREAFIKSGREITRDQLDRGVCRTAFWTTEVVGLHWSLLERCWVFIVPDRLPRFGVGMNLCATTLQLCLSLVSAMRIGSVLVKVIPTNSTFVRSHR